ncbi:uncharacterized protein LOC128679737 [Plodia interpunctella]|uniref:uncharacterized protein LOC128679737 n=1 Tax=Plodia interpunctella TaxID=58824 RepID=UPI002367CC8F|nr:uncharacterized protein LOC128679737 [Plodia interpunctella]
MTTTAAIILTVSLLVNDITFLFGHDSSILEDTNKTPTLVYLFSICLMLCHLNLLPDSLYEKCPLIYHIFEVIISIAIVEFFLYYVWNEIQNFVHRNADDMMEAITDKWHMNRLICYLCCGETGCTENFIALVLKIISFNVLLISSTVYFCVDV